MIETRQIKIVVIGGGTGSFALLSGLKQYTKNITALVSMADDGGSTGVLRDEMGVLPPGDVRQCLVALSRSSYIMRELFNYRFPRDSFAAGHSFGNLFLVALEQITSNFAQGVQVASEVLNIVGRVVPITLSNTRLIMESEDGDITRNQRNISTKSFDGRSMIFRLEPKAIINPVARDAILQADIVVIAPGSLYDSIIPALLVDGVRQALAETAAKVVYVCNLVTNKDQTDTFTVQDFANEIERFIGAGNVDYVLYNTKKPSKELLRRYAKEGEFGVEVDELAAGSSYQLIGSELISAKIHTQDPNDTMLQRTYIRHDGEKVAKQLLTLYRN